MRRNLSLLALILVLATSHTIARAAQPNQYLMTPSPGMECIWAIEHLKGAAESVAWWTSEPGSTAVPAAADADLSTAALRSSKAVSVTASYDTAGRLLNLVTVGSVPQFLDTMNATDPASIVLVWDVLRDSEGLMSRVSVNKPDGTVVGIIYYRQGTTPDVIRESWVDSLGRVRDSAVCHYDAEGRMSSRLDHIAGQSYSTYEEFAYTSDTPQLGSAIHTIPLGALPPATQATRYHINSDGLIIAAEVTDTSSYVVNDLGADGRVQVAAESTITQSCEYRYSLDQIGNWTTRTCHALADGNASIGQNATSVVNRTIVYCSEDQAASMLIPSPVFSGKIVDPSGAGIGGVPVAIQANQAIVMSDADGTWHSGGFIVTPMKEGWTFSPDTRETTKPSASLDFVGTYSLSGRVTDENGTGIQGVAISFSDGRSPVTTGNDGRWTISGVYGRITATPSKKGWQFSPARRILEGPSYDASFSGEFMEFSATGRIVTAGGIGVNGIPVKLSLLSQLNMNMSVTSGPTGYWHQDGLEGNVTVRPESDWFTFSPSFAVVTKNSPEATFTATHRVYCEYFNYSWLFGTPSVSGTPVVARWEDKFTHDWGSGSPAQGVNSNYFAARFRAHVPYDAATYEFTIVSDDGVRLYIDSTLVIDAWYPQDSEKHVVRVEMSQGVHVIEIRYFERMGDASLTVSWAKK